MFDGVKKVWNNDNTLRVFTSSNIYMYTCHSNNFIDINNYTVYGKCNIKIQKDIKYPN